MDVKDIDEGPSGPSDPSLNIVTPNHIQAVNYIGSQNVLPAGNQDID